MPEKSRFVTWAVALGAVLTLFVADVAVAQKVDEEEARVHFRLGRAYYESGRFADAAREFQQAYDLSQRAALLYNVFLSHRDAGNLGDAIVALERYLELTPDAPNKDALSARLRSMKSLYERQGGPTTPADTGGAVPEDEGEGEVETTTEGQASAEGGVAETGSAAETADTEQTETRAEQTVGAALTTEEDEGGGGSAIPWALMGAGGAMIVGSLVTGIMAKKAESNLEKNCTDAGDGTFLCPPGSGFGDKSKGKTLAMVTDVLLATGAATAGTGLALYFVLGKGDGAEEGSTTASVGCGPRGVLGTVRVPF